MSSDPESSDKTLRLQGRYANYFEVGLNQEEVVIDFGQAYGNRESVAFHTRIITSPAYARDLALLLQKSFREFEPTRGLSQSAGDSRGDT
jgi:Protein of unknown function (DUF3467)